MFTYLVDLVAINFADIVRSWLCLLDHFESDWGEDAVLSALTAKVATGSCA